MAVRQALAVVLGVALALPPGAPAAGTGLVKGTVVTEAGVPVTGADVDLLSLDNGTSTRLRTNSGGAFEANLEPGSYKVELQKGYVVVRGPEVVALAEGATAPAELVVASAAAAPAQGSQPVDTAVAEPSRTGDIIALSVFGAALGGVMVYAATRSHEDRQPPTTSGSR
jgi:Carboxypeptidase regulatory-like domain